MRFDGRQSRGNVILLILLDLTVPFAIIVFFWTTWIGSIALERFHSYFIEQSARGHAQRLVLYFMVLWLAMMIH